MEENSLVGQVSGSFLSQKTSSGAGSLCWVPPEHDNTSPLSQEEGLETQPCLQHPAESEPLLPVASVLPAKPCLMFQGPYGLSLLDPTTRGTEESLISKPSDWAMCLVQSNGLCAQMRGYFQEEPLKVFPIVVHVAGVTDTSEWMGPGQKENFSMDTARPRPA
ncbi:uncharacterized protein LOC144235954 isoform X1 [Crocuta crocuta]